MNTGAGLKVELNIEAVWATPREGLPLYELARQMSLLGNTVLEIDEDNNRIKLRHNNG